MGRNSPSVASLFLWLAIALTDVSCQLAPPVVDVALSDVRIPATATAGSTFVVGYTVTNRGDVPVYFRSEVLAAETLQFEDRGFPLVWSAGEFRLVPGQSTTITHQPQLPTGFPTGVYQVRVRIDAAWDAELEMNLTDNQVLATLAVDGASCADLPTEDDEDIVDATWIPTDVPVVGNFCHDPLDTYVFDAEGGSSYVFAARDFKPLVDLRLELYDASGEHLLYSVRGETEAGVPNVFTIPTSSRYVLKVRASGSFPPPVVAGTIGASSDYELFVGRSRPDIRMRPQPIVVNPDAVAAGASTSVGFGYEVDFADLLTSIDFGIYLSTDAGIDASDVLLLQTTVPAPLLRGTFAASVTIPVGTPARRYYVIARADPDDVIAEMMESDGDAGGALVDVLP